MDQCPDFTTVLTPILPSFKTRRLSVASESCRAPTPVGQNENTAGICSWLVEDGSQRVICAIGHFWKSQQRNWTSHRVYGSPLWALSFLCQNLNTARAYLSCSKRPLRSQKVQITFRSKVPNVSAWKSQKRGTSPMFMDVLAKQCHNLACIDKHQQFSKSRNSSEVRIFWIYWNNFFYFSAWQEGHLFIPKVNILKIIYFSSRK